jgi:DNA invertase Pin-like site-specific DNA recombinase
MKRGPNFTPKMYEDIKNLYIKGMTVQKIAIKYEKNLSSIHRVLNKLFTKEELEKVKENRSWGNISTKDEEDIISLLKEIRDLLKKNN